MKSMYRNPVIFIISKLNSRRQLSTALTHQYHGSRRYEEESRSIRVSVWWDIENCEVPSNANVFKVVQSITNAPSINGIKGPMHITAFGDVTRIPRANLELLSAVGVHVTHFPSGAQSRLMKLMYWALENPPPQHLFLISGDEAFADILHQLRRSNYNILLSGPENASSVLCSAATMMWHWSSLLNGDNLSGKLFNQPPDGPNGSWYGHFKAPLEDAFPVTEQSILFPVNESSSELGLEYRYRPIPKVVMRHIGQILTSYPEGMSITQLRAELAKCEVSIDKDFYGYKKFSRFLLAMPQILKLHSGDDGRFLVQGIKSKLTDESALVLKKEPKIINELSESSVSAFRPNGRTSSTDEESKQSMMMPPFREPKLQSKSGNMRELQKEDKSNADCSSIYSQNLKVRANSKDMEKEKGQKGSCHKSDVNEMHNIDETSKLVQQPKEVETASSVATVASSADEIKDSDKIENNEPADSEHRSSPKYGIFRKLWIKIFGGDENHVRPDNKSMTEANIKEQNCEKPDLESIISKNLDLFSKDSFWEELRSFIDTSQGLALFSQSKTREHLARNLQEHGPEVLRSLSVDDLRHLVDLLISDRKWIEELEPQTFPFKVTRLSERNLSNNKTTSPINGLSHIFSCKPTNLGESSERTPRNPPHTGASGRVSSNFNKPKGEILADCQKLVDQIVDNHLNGFNMGLFRQHFVDKYGYALDLQKLGYEKLVNLLQDMSGIRIESSLILPGAALKGIDQNPVNFSIEESKIDKVGANSHGESSELSGKDDESNSAWDELGPVDFLRTKKIEKDYRLHSVKSQNRKKQLAVPKYELPVENDFSDSDEETSLTKSSAAETKSKSEDEDSSLIQILDQWYGEKDDNQTKENSVNGAETYRVSTTTGYGYKSDLKHPMKHRYGKSYTFVTEEAKSSCKDSPTHGMLSVLKNSVDKSAESLVEGERLSASR